MRNPIDYLTQHLKAHSAGYRKLVVTSYISVPRLIFFGSGLPFFIKGLWNGLLGRTLEKNKQFTYGSITWGNLIIKRTKTKIHLSNEINIPETGHMVFINHVNELDFPFDCVVVNKPFLANQAIKSSVVAYWWMKAMGSEVFDTSHQRTIATSVRNLVKGLKNYSFIVYPEGHNSYSEEIKPLKKGMVKLAFDNKIPIVIVLKSGIRKFQDVQIGNTIGYRFAGRIEPEKFSKWEDLRDHVFETMKNEKEILDKEISS
ncbi:MAG: 1-acyl-sn-glycerol-3-phosphate acyltransferase [Leptospiraceae bacterium]|nr:1-acyl-sn-glycerol-3-phosphate acyltransferase [Leptospiraceae bacterium]